MTIIHVELKGMNRLVKKYGLEPGGRTQRFFTSEVMRLSDPYVPFSAGILKNTKMMDSDGTSIIYNTPYARYHWYGKLMVAENGSSYAKFGEEKVLTDTNMQYQGAPLRGPRWVERAWIDNRKAIIPTMERYMKNDHR